MEKMMRYTIYVSQAAKAFSESDLSTLLERSREWNSAHGISGLLVYRYNNEFKRGNFLQLIEGTEDAIQETWKRISSDPRHHTLIVLDEGDSEARMFSDWSMGFRNVDEKNLANVSGFSELGSDEFWENVKKHGLPDALSTLRSFYDGV
jgi:hypothetical protein